MPIFELQHPDGRSFEVDAPDMKAAAEAIGGLGQSAQSQAGPPAAPEAKPYSLGPIGDITELGARGINSIAQALPSSIRPEPRAPQPMGQPINLPLVGQPSAVEMGKGLYQSGKSAAALPGDVYAGKVDPLSEEGIGRAAELANFTQLPTMANRAYRAPVAPLSVQGIRDTAVKTMNAVRDETRSVPIHPGDLEKLSENISTHVNKTGPSWKEAGQAHAAIKDISKTSRESADLGDLVDSRSALMEIVREGWGKNRKAAQMAVAQIDNTLEEAMPGLVSRVREADKNYAIAMATSKQEKAITQAIDEGGNAGTGGNVGNKIRQAVQKDLKKGLAKDRLAPEVRGAMESVTQPGKLVNALRPLSAFDPTHSKLGAMFSMPAAMAAAPASGGWSLATPAIGYASRAMYDRIMKQRAAKISEAMRAQAPAAMANPGFQGGIVGLPQPRLPSPAGILNLVPKPSDTSY